MRLRELKRFRRTTWGQVPAEVIARLRIPAPPDVITQLFIEFGVARHIQEQFGDVDFHFIRWQLDEAPVKELARARLHRCSLSFEEHVTACRREARDGGVEAIAKRRRHEPDVASAWRTKKTWARPPLADASRGDDVLHWIEGHTRLGYLLGLMDAGVVDPDSRHSVWCMHRTTEAAPNSDAWREVLRGEHIRFTDWVVLAQGEDSPRGRYGSALVKAEFGHPPRRFTPDLDGAASIVGDTPELRALHAEWLRVAGGGE